MLQSNLDQTLRIWIICAIVFSSLSPLTASASPANYVGQTQAEQPEGTETVTPESTITATPTIAATAIVTATATALPATATAAPTLVATVTATVPTPTVTSQPVTATATATVNPPTATATLTPTVAVSPTATLMPTVSITTTPTTTPTIVASPTATATLTPTITTTPVITITPIVTVTATPVISITPTPLITLTPTITAPIIITDTPTITVTPEAQFSVFPRSGNAPLLVTFFNTSTDADRFLWNFGDGLSSAESNPNHSYQQPGVYTVSLQASDGSLTDTLTRVGYITVTEAIVAGFSAFPTEGTAPLPVLFFDNSVGASSYLWHFGDGFTSTESSALHSYDQPGVYTVTLQVGNGQSHDTLTRSHYITVNNVIKPQNIFAGLPKATRQPAGPPAQVRLKATHDQLPADGQSRTTVMIWVADAQGRPVAEDTQVTLTLDNNRIQLRTNQLKTHEGLALVGLQAGQQAGAVTLRADAGSVSGQINLTLTEPEGNRLTSNLAEPDAKALAQLARRAKYSLSPGPDNSLTAEDEHFAATFKPNGQLVFNRKGETSVALTFQLQQIAQGGSVIYQGGQRQLIAEDNIARYQNSQFQEEYEVINGGVEQFFILKYPVQGNDRNQDLVISSQFQTDLVGKYLSHQEGIAFYPSRGSRGKSDPGLLRYSGALVQDDNGQTIYAQIALRNNQLRLTIPGDWLAQARYPVVIDPLIGDPTIISDPRGGASEAALAHNSSSNEYLVVWEEATGSGESELYAHRVSTSGTLLGQALEISLAQGSQSNAALVYNDSDDEYLIVWEDTRNGTPSDLYGQLLDDDGTLLGSAFLVATATLTTGHRMPALAYNSSDNHYLMAAATYTDSSGLADKLYVQALQANGALSGTALLVSSSGSEQSSPALAYNPDDNEFLLSWQDGRNSSFDIYARRLQANGQLTGSEIAVVTSSNDQLIPKAAYIGNSGSGQYLVGWRHHNGDGTYKPQAQRLSSTGTAQGSVINIMGSAVTYAHFDLVSNGTNKYLVVADVADGDGVDVRGRPVNPDGSMGSAFGLANNSEPDQLLPVAVYNSSDDSYLAAWEDYRSGYSLIFGQQLNNSFSKVGSNFNLSGLAITRKDPVVTANPDSALRPYLAVWTEDRAGSDDIYGVWLDAAGQGSGDELAISLTTGDEAEPAVAYNPASQQALVVWHSDHGANGKDIYAQRVTTQGLVGQVITLTTASGNQASPRVAANPQTGEWLVVWHDAVPWRNQGRLVSSSGTLLTETQINVNGNAVDVVYNPDDNEYLAVWQATDYVESEEHLAIQRLGAVGNLIGASQPITTPQGSAHYFSSGLSVAYHQAAHEYLLTWVDGYVNSIIHGQRILTDSTLSGGVITIYDYGGPTDGYQTNPAVVYDASAEQYLVVWRVWGNYPYLAAVQLDGQGDPLDAVAPLVDSWWSKDTDHPQLAYNANLQRSMLVWKEMDNDIYAQPYVIPQAVFSATPLSGHAPLNVTFVNSSTNVSSYLWHFGDGLTSTLVSPTHTYTLPGVYTVSLVATGENSSHTLTRSHYITVTGAITRDWYLIPTTTTLPITGEHALAYDTARERVVLYGGNASGWPYETTTWEYDGSDWITTTNQGPDARYGAQTAYLAAEGVLLFGGSDQDDTALNQTWLYTNATWSQLSPSTVPLSRTYHSLALNSISNTIYLFGGNDTTTYFNDLWRYESGDWMELSIGGAKPISRTLAAMSYDTGQNRLLLFGGRTVTGSVLADLWAYNVVSNTWQLLDDGGGGGDPPARMAHSLTYYAVLGQTILAGGAAADGVTLLDDTWRYDAANGWADAEPSMPLTSRAYHQAVIGDGVVILISNGEVWRYE